MIFALAPTAGGLASGAGGGGGGGAASSGAGEGGGGGGAGGPAAAATPLNEADVEELVRALAPRPDVGWSQLLQPYVLIRECVHGCVLRLCFVRK